MQEASCPTMLVLQINFRQRVRWQVTFRGSFASPATMAWPYGLPVVPSSLFFTITAFFPAYLPVRRMTTFPGCTGRPLSAMCLRDLYGIATHVHSSSEGRGPFCSAEDVLIPCQIHAHRRTVTWHFLRGKRQRSGSATEDPSMLQHSP